MLSDDTTSGGAGLPSDDFENLTPSQVREGMRELLPAALWLLSQYVLLIGKKESDRHNASMAYGWLKRTLPAILRDADDAQEVQAGDGGDPPVVLRPEAGGGDGLVEDQRDP